MKRTVLLVIVCVLFLALCVTTGMPIPYAPVMAFTSPFESPPYRPTPPCCPPPDSRVIPRQVIINSSRTRLEIEPITMPMWTFPSPASTGRERENVRENERGIRVAMEPLADRARPPVSKPFHRHYR